MATRKTNRPPTEAAFLRELAFIVFWADPIAALVTAVAVRVGVPQSGLLQICSTTLQASRTLFVVRGVRLRDGK